MQIPKNSPIVYVTFSAEINQNTTEALIAAMSDCINLRVEKVSLLISTPGGSTMNGLNLYNFLQGVPFELTTHNIGNVDSIGNAIFLAGKSKICYRISHIYVSWCWIKLRTKPKA